MDIRKLGGALGNAAGRIANGMELAGLTGEALDQGVARYCDSPDLANAAREYALKLVKPVTPVFVAKPPKVVVEHKLRKKFKTTKAAIEAGAYPDGHDNYISDTTYPIREGMQEDVDLVGLDASESFDHEPTTAELLALFSQYGYERPVYEDGLRDGAEYPAESYDRPHVYLHEPDTGGGVLFRRWWFGERRLYRSFDSPDDRWGRQRCVFFARRKSKA